MIALLSLLGLAFAGMALVPTGTSVAEDGDEAGYPDDPERPVDLVTDGDDADPDTGADPEPADDGDQDPDIDPATDPSTDPDTGVDDGGGNGGTDDIMQGTDGRDYLDGQDGDDAIYGGGGADELHGDARIPGPARKGRLRPVADEVAGVVLQVCDDVGHEPEPTAYRC